MIGWTLVELPGRPKDPFAAYAIGEPDADFSDFRRHPWIDRSSCVVADARNVVARRALGCLLADSGSEPPIWPEGGCLGRRGDIIHMGISNDLIGEERRELAQFSYA